MVYRSSDLLYAIRKRWKMILAFVLVGCGFGAAASISYVQEVYKLRLTVHYGNIGAETGNFTGNSVILTPNDFILAQDMVDAVGM